ncbi:hypothetical protein AB0873_31075 [Micromonospora sp. NPDC047707]|uniref:hypothetical protein n=1 Tax=Micromonospora sp. NPDC047707 TaxID=3154498 RepID=UPI003456FCE5
MSSLVSAEEVEFRVTFGMFALVTGAGGDPLADERPIAAIVDGGVGFFSAARDHSVSVRLEFWDAEPDDPPLDECVVAGDVVLAASAVALVGIDGGGYREFPAPFDGRARVLVSCTGREEAARLERDEHEAFFSDVEYWLVWMWPHRA